MRVEVAGGKEIEAATSHAGEKFDGGAKSSIIFGQSRPVVSLLPLEIDSRLEWEEVERRRRKKKP